MLFCLYIGGIAVIGFALNTLVMIRNKQFGQRESSESYLMRILFFPGRLVFVYVLSVIVGRDGIFLVY